MPDVWKVILPLQLILPGLRGAWDNSEIWSLIVFGSLLQNSTDIAMSVRARLQGHRI